MPATVAAKPHVGVLAAPALIIIFLQWPYTSCFIKWLNQIYSKMSPMSKQTINPPQLFNSLQYGFSQIVTTTGGKTVYLSGQVAWNEDQEIIGGDDLGEQTRQTLRNVETAVQIAGGGMSDVVSMRIYFLDSKKHETAAISQALLDCFADGEPPATTWTGVPSLANDAFLIEIEAMAVIEVNE